MHVPYFVIGDYSIEDDSLRNMLTSIAGGSDRIAYPVWNRYFWSEPVPMLRALMQCTPAPDFMWLKPLYKSIFQQRNRSSLAFAPYGTIDSTHALQIFTEYVVPNYIEHLGYSNNPNDDFLILLDGAMILNVPFSIVEQYNEIKNVSLQSIEKLFTSYTFPHVASYLCHQSRDDQKLFVEYLSTSSNVINYQLSTASLIGSTFSISDWEQMWNIDMVDFLCRTEVPYDALAFLNFERKPDLALVLGNMLVERRLSHQHRIQELQSDRMSSERIVLMTLIDHLSPEHATALRTNFLSNTSIREYIYHDPKLIDLFDCDLDDVWQYYQGHIFRNGSLSRFPEHPTLWIKAIQYVSQHLHTPEILPFCTQIIKSRESRGMDSYSQFPWASSELTSSDRLFLWSILYFQQHSDMAQENPFRAPLYWSIAFLLSRDVSVVVDQDARGFVFPDIGSIVQHEFSDNYLDNSYTVSQSLTSDTEEHFRLFLQMSKDSYNRTTLNILELEP